MEEQNISVREYEEHKASCGKSFDDLFKQIDRLNRAVIGEPELKKKGLMEMTEEMYKSVIMADGGKKVFILLVKISGGILTIIGTFWAIYEFIKRVKIQ